MKTLEQYLKENVEKGIIDHSLRSDGKTFYIHAEGRDSDTLDFEVNGNSLKPNPAVTRMDETVKTLECRECGLFTDDGEIIDKCDTNSQGNYICPECGSMAIVTEVDAH